MRRQVLLGDVGAHEPGLRRHPVRCSSRDTDDLGDGGIGAERVNYRRADIPGRTSHYDAHAGRLLIRLGAGSPLSAGRLAQVSATRATAGHSVSLHLAANTHTLRTVDKAV
jgi:hypothetical protein